MTDLAESLRSRGIHRVGLVMAHPDDEVIFGWPLLQEPSIEKEILVCSSDLHNPARRWCRKRKYALFTLCRELGIPCTCLDHHSEFYRLDPREGALREMLAQVLEAAGRIECDAFFTHNSHGEYGHLDHMLVHQLMAAGEKPLLFTDIFLESSWSPLAGQGELQRRLYHGIPVAECACDLSRYGAWEALYRSHDAWTWSREPVTACTLYRA